MTQVDDFGGWAGLLGQIVAGNDLSSDQAAAAMSEILAGRATPAQIAGLIVGLRIKGESVEEMTGMVEAMMGAATPLTVRSDSIDIVGTGGSAFRRRHALNVSTMASLVAAAAGATVCKHGNYKASSTSGSFDFLQALGVKVDLTPQALETCIDQVGVGFALARTFHPAMRHAAPVRSELGVSTVLNTLGPLANPGRVRRQVVGTASETSAAKMARVLQNTGSVKAWVVVGHMGLDELTTTGSSIVYDVSPDTVERVVVEPQDAGLEVTADVDELVGGDAGANVKIFNSILDGSERGPRYDMVLLNAAAGLVVAGLADDLAAGAAHAAAVIDNSQVEAKIRQLIECSNQGF